MIEHSAQAGMVLLWRSQQCVYSILCFAICNLVSFKGPVSGPIAVDIFPGIGTDE